MVLDTNVRELNNSFKYSVINKAICVILCLVTFLSAAGITSLGVMTVAYMTDNAVGDYKEPPKSWTETSEFRYKISQDAIGIAQKAYIATEEKDIRKTLTAYKSKAVAEAVAQNEAYWASRVDNGDGGYYFENDSAISVAVPSSEYGDFYTEATDDESISKAELEKRFAEKYDDFVGQAVNNLYLDVWYNISIGEVNAYAKFGKNVEKYIIGDKKFSEKDALNSDYCLVIKQGKLIAHNGIPKKVAQQIVNNSFKNDDYAKKTDVYVYFNDEDVAVEEGFVGFFGMFGRDKQYSNLKYTAGVAQQFSEDFVQYAVLDVILLVVSFICGFYYFSICGKRREDEPAKVYPWDYVPVELQLGAVGGIGFGTMMLVLNISDDWGFSFVAAILTAATAFSWWILLMGLCTSIARYAHSDKKFYKHFTTYWVFYGLFVASKFIFKKIGSLFKKMNKSAKRTFSVLTYKPTKFKRNLIILGIIYAVLNLSLIGLIALMFVGAFPIAIILILGDLVGNFFIFRRVLEYIKNLDMIIDASSRHEEVNVDIDTLDESLKILAESMRYTNAELQTAINQAVKDERLRTELITNVSHDLKTPLTSIITYVDLLSKCDITDEKAREYIGVLDEKGAKLKRLIDDLIEASKLNTGHITVNLAPMNLSELCLQATVDAQADFEKAGLDLIVKSGDKPVTAIADGTKAYRVIQNLLSNAKKYSAKASRVYVSVYEENGQGIFEIKNISAQPLDITADELTERFVRGDASRNMEGNGLGLSIAKELCKAQKGELELIIDGDLFKARVKLPQ